MADRAEAMADFFDELDARGLLDYGAVIEGQLVRELMVIDLPEFGRKADFDRAALAELSAIGYVRDQLLKNGKYLAGTAGGYRVLLPSENARQVDALMESASRKLSRARVLNATTPVEFQAQVDQQEARISMTRTGMASRFRPGGSVGDQPAAN
jgi:hypothetical protein